MTLEVQLSQMRRFVYILALMVLALACAVVAQWRSRLRLQHRDTLQLRQLTITDAQGKPRVILGSPLPAPLRFGKPGHRDGDLSGMLIVDPTGTERGGYATGDDPYSNAVLTLDAQGNQTVLLLAEPGGSTLFRLWNGTHGSVTAGVGDDPFLNLKQPTKLLFAAPQNNPQSTDQRPLFR